MSFCSNSFQHNFQSSIGRSSIDFSLSSSSAAASWASILWILSSSLSEGVVTNLSVIQIPSWFFALTPFEAIFTGFTFLWICGLQYVGILPINLNNLFYGSPSGRRKRSLVSSSVASSTIKINPQIEKVVETLLQILKRMDKDECVPRMLCEIEKQRIEIGYKPPLQIEFITSILKSSSQLKNSQSEDGNLEEDVNNNPFEFYEEAINVAQNSTTCEVRYSECNIKQGDVLKYVQRMRFDEII